MIKIKYFMSGKKPNAEELKAKLTSEQYNIMFNKATEPAFSGRYDKHFENGTYLCAACNNPLFTSEDKYDSGSGWPSFSDVYQESAIEQKLDKSMGMIRVEVQCANCGGHLGHVFEDGPLPTGRRYCINSASLQFE